MLQRILERLQAAAVCQSLGDDWPGEGSLCTSARPTLKCLFVGNIINQWAVKLFLTPPVRLLTGRELNQDGNTAGSM